MTVLVLRRGSLGAAVVLSALLCQGLLSRLPLPGTPPDLLLVVVVAFALAEGPVVGAVTGFVAGLLVDLGADHELGRVAFAYALVGFVVGTRSRPDSSRLRAIGLAGLAGAGGVTVFAAGGLLLGDPRVTAATYAGGLAATIGWCVALSPLVVPFVGMLVRRLDPDPFRRLSSVR